MGQNIQNNQKTTAASGTRAPQKSPSYRNMAIIGTFVCTR